MAFGQQILLVQVPLCSIGRRCFSIPPVFGQQELVVGVDDLHQSFFQTLLGHVVQIQPGDLLPAQILNRPGRLRGTQIAPVAKQRGDKPKPRLSILPSKPDKGPNSL